MADRQDFDRDRTSDRDRDRDRDRWEYDRRQAGSWDRREGGQGNYGRGEWDRERNEPSQGRGEHRGYEWGGGNESRGNEWSREGDWGRGNRFERQGDWNREIWGEQRARRPDWDREGAWGRGEGRRDWGREGGYAGRTGGSSDWNRTNDREGQVPFGAGQRGFGTGPSYYSGSSSYYGGGQGYGGGTGSYNEQGRFAGRGPKGYQRSDDRIREDVCERLTQHPRVDASDIEIQVSGGEVTLSGVVNDRESKRIAEDVAENVSGVKDVHNHIRLQIRVEGQSSPGETSTGQTATGSQSGTTPVSAGSAGKKS